MEIKEKVKIGFRDSVEELDAVIDTGADITMINEEVLLKLGVPQIGNWSVHFGGEFEGTKPVYPLLFLQIKDCVISVLNVIGGNKNLIGHDILQRAKAVIDEGKGTIEFPVDDGTIEM